MALGAWDDKPVIRADRPDVRMKVEDEVGPGFVATMGAAMRKSNPIGSFIANETFRDGIDPWEIEDGFDTLGYLREKHGAAFEAEHGDRFLEVFNRPYADALKRQIDMETDDRKTLDAAGFGGVMADLFASVVDPTNLIPGGSVVKSVRAGKAVLGTARNTAVAGALAASVSEVALQSTQETRTVGESVMAIGGSAILAGVLGGTIGGAVARAERRALSARLYADLNAPASAAELHDIADDLQTWIGDVKAAASRGETMPGPARGGDDVLASEGRAIDAGAAATTRQSIDDLTIAGTAARRTAEETAWLNPGLRLFNSPSVAARGLVEGLGEWTLYLKKNFGPNARPTEQAVESLVERYMGGVATATHRINGEVYRGYRNGGGTMNREAFNREVGRAMRRNDEHPIPEVAKAAKEYRKRVVEPVLARAIEVGLLPKDVSTRTAASYFPRLWNRQRLVAEEGAFKSVVAGWMGGELDRVIEALRGKLAKLEENIRREVDDLEMAALRRDEELRRREAGEEADIAAFNDEAGADMTEADVLRMIRTVRTATPPKVETLKDWIAKQGGLYDPGGDVARLEYRRPGFIKKKRRSLHAVAGDQGGLRLDDAARAAWEDGFFPGHVERPTPAEFLEALSDDIGGNPVVREADYEAARVIREHTAIEEALTRMGVDLDRPRFATSEALRDVLRKVNAALRAADQDRIAALKRKLADVRSRHEFEVEAYTGAERSTTIQEAVEAVFDKLTGRLGDTMPALRNVIPTRRGPLKERSFGIPDSLVEQWLENDADMVMRRHARIGGAEVKLAGKYGSPDMADALAELAADYRRLRDAIGQDAKLSPDQRAAALKALDKRERADRDDVETVRDMLRGTHNAHLEGRVWLRPGCLPGAALLPLGARLTLRHQRNLDGRARIEGLHAEHCEAA